MVETYKLSLEEWRRMAEAGVFENKRLEFRYGDIIEMTPVGKEHFKAVTLLTKTLVEALGERALISPQNPLAMGEVELYPDFAILQPRDYEDLPGPRDVLWVVEVSKSSLGYDRTIKAEDYARAGIPEYWIAALSERRFEVWLEPQGESYLEERHYSFEEAFAPKAFPELERVWLKGY